MPPSPLHPAHCCSAPLTLKQRPSSFLPNPSIHERLVLHLPLDLLRRPGRRQAVAQLMLPPHHCWPAVQCTSFISSLYPSAHATACNLGDGLYTATKSILSGSLPHALLRTGAAACHVMSCHGQRWMSPTPSRHAAVACVVPEGNTVPHCPSVSACLPAALRCTALQVPVPCNPCTPGQAGGQAGAPHHA